MSRDATVRRIRALEDARLDYTLSLTALEIDDPAAFLGHTGRRLQRQLEDVIATLADLRQALFAGRAVSA